MITFKIIMSRTKIRQGQNKRVEAKTLKSEFRLFLNTTTLNKVILQDLVDTHVFRNCHTDD